MVHRSYLPPLAECVVLEKKSDSSESTAETTLVFSSSSSWSAITTCNNTPPEKSPTAVRNCTGSMTPPYATTTSTTYNNNYYYSYNATAFELPTIVEKNSRKRRLEPPSHRTKGPIETSTWTAFLGWGLFIIFTIIMLSRSLWIRGFPSPWPDSKSMLQVGLLPASELERQLFLSKLLQRPPHNSFTIVLRGTRPIRLRSAVDRYQNCAGVYDIHIDWRATLTEIPALSFFGSPKVLYTSNAPKTLKGVLVLDESVQLSCHDLTRAYLEWKKDPTRAVGFFPLYASDGSYSMVSDRALLVHRNYLPSGLFSSSHSCQEWVLSARVAALSRKHPVALIGGAGVEPNEPPYNPSCQTIVSQHLQVNHLPATKTIFLGDGFGKNA